MDRTALDSIQIRNALLRISHEILERNGGIDSILLVGIHTRGVPLAWRLSNMISDIRGDCPSTGALDIGLHRDDSVSDSFAVARPTTIKGTVQEKRVVLVDDVLYTGRSIRAAMDALNDLGRPSQIQLAVLIDRGHRELPIRPDYVGKNVPTSLNEVVRVRLTEIDGTDEVIVLGR